MDLEHIVEALIFASPDGVSERDIARVINEAAAGVAEDRPQQADQAEQADQADLPPTNDLELHPHERAMLQYAGISEDRITAAIVSLIRQYEQEGRAFTLVERPTGWRIAARPEYSPWLKRLFPDKKPTKLSPSALETLAIIAYRQPVTKASIEAVRGVSVDGPMQTLLDRNIIRIAGRADLPGRPLLYETTDLFLEHIGIKSVDELPNASELRAVKLPDPPAPPAKADPKAAQPGLPGLAESP